MLALKIPSHTSLHQQMCHHCEITAKGHWTGRKLLTMAAALGQEKQRETPLLLLSQPLPEAALQPPTVSFHMPDLVPVKPHKEPFLKI